MKGFLCVYCLAASHNNKRLVCVVVKLVVEVVGEACLAIHA